MSLPVNITSGGAGITAKATVSRAGQLIVSTYDYDLTKFVILDVNDTGYTFYSPKANFHFVITGIVAKADRGVSPTTDADVIVFEADDDSSATVDRTLFQLAMVQGDQVVLTPLNILVNEGKFVNAKTSDDDIYMTIMGYYIPASDRAVIT